MSSIHSAPSCDDLFLGDLRLSESSAEGKFLGNSIKQEKSSTISSAFLSRAWTYFFGDAKASTSSTSTPTQVAPSTAEANKQLRKNIFSSICSTFSIPSFSFPSIFKSTVMPKEDAVGIIFKTEEGQVSAQSDKSTLEAYTESVLAITSNPDASENALAKTSEDTTAVKDGTTENIFGTESDNDGTHTMV